MFNLYDAALFSGIFWGQGPRQVHDPRSGMGMGMGMGMGTGTGTGKISPRERGRAVLARSGSRTSACSPAGIAQLTSILVCCSCECWSLGTRTEEREQEFIKLQN